MKSIGDGVAILQGTTERRGESPLRQSNQFFYLTGVTEPRAMLIIDGKAQRSTLFLTPRTAARERAIGPYLDVGDSSARATGLDAIVPRDSFTTAVSRLAAEQRKIFTPFRPEVLGSESAGDVQSHVRITKMRSVGRPAVARRGVHRPPEDRGAVIRGSSISIRSSTRSAP